LHIVDTAGLREAQDPVEQVGIARSHEAISKADIVLWVADAARPETQVVDTTLIDRLAIGAARIFVINKIDLVSTAPELVGGGAPITVRLSAKSGVGLDALAAEILRAAGWGNGEGVFLARARHLHALNLGAKHLAAAIDALSQLEFCAEELRLAQVALGSITGEVSADDLLGKIFSQFCIGK
jgi:tRNA modification GTPase